jgi:hypothetical protein
MQKKGKNSKSSCDAMIAPYDALVANSPDTEYLFQRLQPTYGCRFVRDGAHSKSRACTMGRGRISKEP